MSNTIVPFKHRTGIKAFAVQDGSTKLYFIWCYKSETFANIMLDRARIKDANDQQTNWRADMSMLVLSDRVSL